MNASKRVGHWIAVCGLLLAWLFLAGCQTDPASNQFSDTKTLVPGGTNIAAKTNEILQPGDTLNIVYGDLPVPAPPFDGRINEDGTVTLFMNKTFTAAGKTRGDLAKEIRSRYVPSQFPNMTVTINLAPSSLFFYVGGEVKAPGAHGYAARITVTKAIQSAGDFTEYANKKNVQLVHLDGRKETINCLKVLKDPRLDPEVYPGDKITVFRSAL